VPERFASSRKLARIAEAVHPPAPPRTARLTPRAWALALLSLPVVTFAVLVRFRGLYDVFCRTPDELAEVMPGLRLHALPFFNLAAPVPYNFFKPMFYSQHGLGDVSFYYLASALVSLLGSPIAERNLFVAGGVASLGLALAGGLFCGRVLGRPLMGWIFALLVLVSPFYVLVSRTGWARLSWTPLLLFALFLAQATATTRRGVVRPAVFWALAGLVSLTDGFVAFPLLPVLALVRESGTLAERVRNVARDRVFVIGLALFGLGLAFDVALGVLAHLKGSNLTMMGYVIQRGSGGFRLSRVHLIAWGSRHRLVFPVPWRLGSRHGRLAAGRMGGPEGPARRLRRGLVARRLARDTPLRGRPRARRHHAAGAESPQRLPATLDQRRQRPGDNWRAPSPAPRS
jgi:hypothetical protein